MTMIKNKVSPKPIPAPRKVGAPPKPPITKVPVESSTALLVFAFCDSTGLARRVFFTEAVRRHLAHLTES